MSGRKSLKDMLSGANTPTAWASADAKLGSDQPGGRP